MSLLVPTRRALYGIRTAPFKARWTRAFVTTRVRLQETPVGDKRLNKPSFDKYPLFMVAIPVTSQRAFIYSKHTSAALGPSGKESLETRAINKAVQMWQKMEKSTNTVNQKVVYWVNKLLWKVPWLESSLQTIPSKKMLEVVSQLDENVPAVKDGSPPASRSPPSSGSIKLTTAPLFFPDRLLNPSRFLQRLLPKLPQLRESQRKAMIKDILLLPLTAPCILLPIVPNVPGFWLCYRAYCHYKATHGIDNLRFYVDHHISPTAVASIDSIYKETADELCRANLDAYLQDPEMKDDVLLLSEDTARLVCKELGAEEATHNLLVAIKQERDRLGMDEGPLTPQDPLDPHQSS